ncbi:RQC-minor-1 family DNA-binding protein [Caldanaerobacter subterraneus]|uniref:RQC domain protein n=1 Tax=Caldanaerobacter subterraneus TaxID=911092 RepID=A0A7Y2L9Y8_9THEO|nr:RQC-minor-1 family DNA-binding protein [Caldanaerobacter subterraneus]NNG68085.1 RQC domain protein [Caldanaerobacter subterraneus]
MGRTKQKVRYKLNSGGIKSLSDEEIKVILRAADELIGTGGRSMLAKILKGSKDKKVLKYGLNKCPSYGYYCELTMEEITKRIDWMIKSGYLKIEYSGRLPVLIFTEKGWEIERETYANELLNKLTEILEDQDYSFVYELKDRNRGMILLLIEKIKNTKNARFIPLLKEWKRIEYKKVQTELQKAIDYLMKVGF